MIATLVCLLVMWVWHLLTPYWWGVMLVPFAYGAGLARTGWRAFRTGLLAAGILWLGASLSLYFSGSGIIASRMAGMFGLGRHGLMIAATTLVAAIAAGLSGYAGYAVGVLFRKPAKRTDTKERS
jgi:hypothetical protein